MESYKFSYRKAQTILLTRYWHLQSRPAFAFFKINDLQKLKTRSFV